MAPLIRNILHGMEVSGCPGRCFFQKEPQYPLIRRLGPTAGPDVLALSGFEPRSSGFPASVPTVFSRLPKAKTKAVYIYFFCKVGTTYQTTRRYCPKVHIAAQFLDQMLTAMKCPSLCDLPVSAVT